MEKILEKHEKEKKKKYLQPCLERRRHFTPFVTTTDGLIGKEAQKVRSKTSHTPSGKMEESIFPGNGLPTRKANHSDPQRDIATDSRYQNPFLLERLLGGRGEPTYSLRRTNFKTNQYIKTGNTKRTNEHLNTEPQGTGRHHPNTRDRNFKYY